MSIKQVDDDKKTGKMTSVCGVVLASLLVGTALADSTNQIKLGHSKTDNTSRVAESNSSYQDDNSKVRKDNKKGDADKPDKDSLSDLLEKNVESANQDAKKAADSSSITIKNLLSGKTGSALASLNDNENGSGLMKLSDVTSSDNKGPSDSNDVVKKAAENFGNAMDNLAKDADPIKTALAVDNSSVQTGGSSNNSFNDLVNKDKDTSNDLGDIITGNNSSDSTDNSTSTGSDNITNNGSISNGNSSNNNPGSNGDSSNNGSSSGNTGSDISGGGNTSSGDDTTPTDPIKQYTLQYNIIAQVLNKDNEKVNAGSGSLNISSNDCTNGIYNYDFTDIFNDFMKQNGYELADGNSGNELKGSADFNEGDNRTVTITVGVNAKDSNDSSDDNPGSSNPSNGNNDSSSVDNSNGSSSNSSNTNNSNSSSSDTTSQPDVAPPKDSPSDSSNGSNQTTNDLNETLNSSTLANDNSVSIQDQNTTYDYSTLNGQTDNKNVANYSVDESENKESNNNSDLSNAKQDTSIATLSEVNVPESSDTKMATTVQSSQDNNTSSQSTVSSVNANNTTQQTASSMN